MSIETEGYNVPEEVKRQLVAHNALIKQINSNYSGSTSELTKKIVSTALEGDIVKKYRCQTSLKRKIGCFAKGKTDNKRRSQKRRDVSRNLITTFFKRDDVTTLTPGKKQVIVRGKVKMQKRLLNDNLRSLHKKFIKETSYNIGFTSFCKYRPFWAVKPKLSDRDSCMCKKHSNMQFKLDALVRQRLHVEKNVESLCSFVTCDQNVKECMMNTCEKCSQKEAIDISKIKEENTLIKYFCWKIEKELITKNNKTFSVTKTVKVVEKRKLLDVCKGFNEEFRNIFCPHVFRKNHQTKERQKCLAELSYDEAAVHIDFSENYVCKLHAEIQAMHFGSSHNQATLHTVVVYTEDGTNTMCSISQSKRHDPSAIWAHLMPILHEIRGKNIDTVHFFSDGPASQYKNKDSFYFLHTVFRDMGFKYAT